MFGMVINKKNMFATFKRLKNQFTKVLHLSSLRTWKELKMFSRQA